MAVEVALSRPDGLLVVPDGVASTYAVLVLSGSSGRIEEHRVRLLARSGVAAMSVRWFGGTGQPPGICEVALESLSAQLDRLVDYAEHLAVLGTSKGAEAALLLAAEQRRIGLVIALSPSSVVWANVGAGVDGRDRPLRSSWTCNGEPLPFVPYDQSWSAPPGQPPAFRSMYERSMALFPEKVRQATIPVERISGRLILSSGGDDQMWPSSTFASAIAARRADHGLNTISIVHPDAGHRLIFPGEPATTGDDRGFAYGGSASANAELGRGVWLAMMDAFRIGARGD